MTGPIFKRSNERRRAAKQVFYPVRVLQVSHSEKVSRRVSLSEQEPESPSYCPAGTTVFHLQFGSPRWSWAFDRQNEETTGIGFRRPVLHAWRQRIPLMHPPKRWSLRRLSQHQHKSHTTTFHFPGS